MMPMHMTVQKERKERQERAEKGSGETAEPTTAASPSMMQRPLLRLKDTLNRIDGEPSCSGLIAFEGHRKSCTCVTLSWLLRAHERANRSFLERGSTPSN